MVLRILIIDDRSDGFGRQGWISLCTKHGCESVAPEGATVQTLLPEVERILRGRSIHGTILDISFQKNERLGGIRLYEELESRGLAGKLGRVLVTTQREVDAPEVMPFVERIGADMNKHSDSGHREEKFKEFLQKLQRTFGGGPQE